MNNFIIRMPEDENIFYTTFRYPAGEVQTRLTEKGVKAMKIAQGYQIVLHAVPDVMRLAQLVDALNTVRPVRFRELFLQYMPYSRADRRFMEGDSYGLFVFFQMLKTMNFTAISTFDVHNEEAYKRLGIYFSLTVYNLKPTDGMGDQIRPCLNRMKFQSGIPKEEMALISPDEGARKRYNLSKYDMKILVGGKTRDPITGKLSGFAIDRDVVGASAALIVDDICDGGGTFIGLAQEIRKINPKIKLGLFVSHGIFSKGLEPLRAEFDWVFTSDYSFRKPSMEEGVKFETGTETMPGVCVR